MIATVGSTSNPIVFLDISIADDYAGRVIIELRRDVVPKTAENFRALCTGEKGLGKNGRPLCYRGVKFHRALSQFMVQGGDIVNQNGTSGESIYGGKFEDESFALPHEEGAVSMANEGTSNSNTSQFFIATVPCNHLDGTNVVFGQVLSGLGIIKEIDKCDNTGSEQNELLVHCVIQDCGEISAGEDWGLFGKDGTGDRLPQYPEDWKCDQNQVTVEHLISLLEKTNEAGNFLFKQKKIKAASRKYQKVIRYLKWYTDTVSNEDKPVTQNGQSQDSGDDTTSRLSNVKAKSILNLATTKLKSEDHKDVVCLCSEVLTFQPKNPKALYRRAQANIRLNNYDLAIQDLKKAKRLQPNDKFISTELNKAKNLSSKYSNYLKSVYRKMFV